MLSVSKLESNVYYNVTLTIWHPEYGQIIGKASTSLRIKNGRRGLSASIDQDLNILSDSSL